MRKIITIIISILISSPMFVSAQEDDLAKCKAAAKSKDASSEKYYCLRAANIGNIEAIKHVADVYRDGNDFGKSFLESMSASNFPNYYEAAKWYSKAADLGDVEAQSTLCEWYYGDGPSSAIKYGDGKKDSRSPELNYSKGFSWCSKAARSGNDEAQLKLAWILRRGQGVPQDYEDSMRWYLASARQGNISAMLALANIYDEGKVTTQNHKEAAKWHQDAANKGNLYGQFGMGQRYYYGVGVIKNKALAHMWLNLVASRQVPTKGWSEESGILYDEDARQVIQSAADLRNKLEQSMTTNEIREAQRLAREWKAK